MIGTVVGNGRSCNFIYILSLGRMTRANTSAEDDKLDF